MQREEKSERSRRAVLDAALHLFSHQGYRATTMRQIADRASVSTGNCLSPLPGQGRDLPGADRRVFGDHRRRDRFPFRRVLYGTERFPDNIEQLGYAARDSVRQFRDYLALFYVDVIEFGGTHIQKFYATMSRALHALLRGAGRARRRPRPPPPRRLPRLRAPAHRAPVLQLLLARDPLRRPRAVRQKRERSGERDRRHHPQRRLRASVAQIAVGSRQERIRAAALTLLLPTAYCELPTDR